MAITLDGSTYFCYGTNYHHKQTKLGSINRGLSGSVLRYESQIFRTEYDMVFLCTLAELATLRASFAKTVVASNKLVFIDEEGVMWTPATPGTNDATHVYNSGVYFEPLNDPRVISPRGWNSGNRMQVQLHLITGSYILGLIETGYLLTEAGDYLTTEAGERLLWESNV